MSECEACCNCLGGTAKFFFKRSLLRVILLFVYIISSGTAISFVPTVKESSNGSLTIYGSMLASTLITAFINLMFLMFYVCYRKSEHEITCLISCGGSCTPTEGSLLNWELVLDLIFGGISSALAIRVSSSTYCYSLDRTVPDTVYCANYYSSVAFAIIGMIVYFIFYTTSIMLKCGKWPPGRSGASGAPLRNAASSDLELGSRSNNNNSAASQLAGGSKNGSANNLREMPVKTNPNPFDKKPVWPPPE